MSYQKNKLGVAFGSGKRLEYIHKARQDVENKRKVGLQVKQRNEWDEAVLKKQKQKQDD